MWVRSMMKREKLASANIYVPVKRRATLNPDTVQEIAQSMLEVGQTTPILVRRDGERFVLVHGLHQLEACKATGRGIDLRVHCPSPKALESVHAFKQPEGLQSAWRFFSNGRPRRARRSC